MAPIEQVEDFFGDFGPHRDDSPVVGDPEFGGQHPLEEAVEVISGAG